AAGMKEAVDGEFGLPLDHLVGHRGLLGLQTGGAAPDVLGGQAPDRFGETGQIHLSPPGLIVGVDRSAGNGASPSGPAARLCAPQRASVIRRNNLSCDARSGRSAWPKRGRSALTLKGGRG